MATQRTEITKIEMGALLDFYADLLTPHQQSLMEAYCNEDMSLFELAEQQGISRQGVHDTILRGKRLLMQTEEKLHLLQIYTAFQAKQAQLRALLETAPMDRDAALCKLDELCAIWEENKT